MRAPPRRARPPATGPPSAAALAGHDEQRAHRHGLGVERRQRRARHALARGAPRRSRPRPASRASRCSRRTSSTRSSCHVRVARARVVERQREAGGRDGGQPPLDDLPRRRAGPRATARRSRRPAARRAARRPPAPPSRPGTTSTAGRSSSASSAARASVRAAMPWTPASPEDTRATRAPAAARAQRLVGARGLLAHRAAHDLLPGAQRGRRTGRRRARSRRRPSAAAHRGGGRRACGARRRPGPSPTMSSAPGHALSGLKPAGSSRRCARMKPSSESTSRVGAVGDDDAAVEHDGARAQLERVGEVVGDDERRDAQRGEHVGQLAPRRGVHGRRRLVEDRARRAPSPARRPRRRGGAGRRRAGAGARSASSCSPTRVERRVDALAQRVAAQARGWPGRRRRRRARWA